MKIGLLDIDGHNFPNLALMKISAYHKNNGDIVEWVNFYDNYDIVYKSKIFTFTPNDIHFINTPKIIEGGTGYDYSIKLPEYIDHIQPDYTLYKHALWNDHKTAYGFLTRGCNNNCSWCIVPKKEGKIQPYMDIEEIIQEKKQVVLMDNNILQSDYGLTQIKKIIKLKIKIDFNQALDARLIDRPIAKLLSQVKWLKPVRMSCDTYQMLPYIKKATRYLREYNCTPTIYFIFVLTKDISSALKIVTLLRKWNLDPFSQPYIDFSGKNNISQEQKNFARWVNHKAIFKSISWKDYIR